MLALPSRFERDGCQNEMINARGNQPVVITDSQNIVPCIEIRA